MKKIKSLKTKMKIITAVLLPAFIVSISIVAYIVQRSLLLEKIDASKMVVNSAFVVFAE